MSRLAHLAELEVLGLDGLLDQMVLLWPHLDGRGGGGDLLQAVQHLPDVELLHFSFLFFGSICRGTHNRDRPRQMKRDGHLVYHTHARTHKNT